MPGGNIYKKNLSRSWPSIRSWRAHGRTEANASRPFYRERQSCHFKRSTRRIPHLQRRTEPKIFITLHPTHRECPAPYVQMLDFGFHHHQRHAWERCRHSRNKQIGQFPQSRDGSSTVTQRRIGGNRGSNDVSGGNKHATER